MARPDEDLMRRLGRVRLLSLDVDGVLTDGGLYFLEDGVQARKFNVKDGVGIKRVMGAGVEVAIVSAGISPAVEHRGRVLGLRHVHTGVEDKLEALTAVCEAVGVGLDETAHVGDDLNDLPVLAAVGCPLAVADAIAEVRAAAAWVTEKGGGQGAVRDICDLLLAARGPGG